MATTPEARLRIVVENLARAALQEAKREVQGLGAAGRGAAEGTNEATRSFRQNVFAQLDLLGKSGTTRQGVNALTIGFRQMAVAATGATGPMGNLARAGLLLGGGGGVLLGAAATVGVLGLAWHTLTKDVKAATSALDQFGESLTRAKSPGGQFQALVADLSADLDKMDRRFAVAREINATGLQNIPGLSVLGEIGTDTARSVLASLRERGEREAVEAVLALRNARAGAHQDAATALQREAQLIGLTGEEAARLQAVWQGMPPAIAATFIAAAAELDKAKQAEQDRLEREREHNRLLEIKADLFEEIGRISADVARFQLSTFDFEGLRAEMPFAGTVGQTEEILRAQEGRRVAGLQVAELERQAGDFAFGLDQSFFDRVQAEVGEAIGSLKEPRDTNMQAAQLALMGVTNLARSGGSAAGILGGLGGLASGATGLTGIAATAAAGPLGWAGFGLSALSTGFGLLSRNADKNADRIVKAIERREAAIFEQNASIIVIGPDGHATRRALAQLEDSDAVERIPGPVGARG